MPQVRPLFVSTRYPAVYNEWDGNPAKLRTNEVRRPPNLSVLRLTSIGYDGSLSLLAAARDVDLVEPLILSVNP